MNTTIRTIFLSVLALVLLSLAGPAARANDTDPSQPGALQMPAESVFSRALRFQGDVVERLPSGRAIRKTAFLRGKRFEWVGEAASRSPDVENPATLDRAPDIESLSVEELAENLRGVALFEGHQFVEAQPPLALARHVKTLRELERSGAATEDIAKQLPGRGASQGNAKPTGDLAAAELVGKSGKGGDNVRIVHGADDRRVMNNRAYPHRTHIVFDNTGSTSSINGSQGSGTLIGPSTAMSVAHVFWHEANNTWESTHRWAPGYDSQDADPSPYGEWYGCYWVTIPTGYTIYESTSYDYAVLDFDVGCNSVRNGVNSDNPGTTVGWLGNYTASASAIEGRTGYMRGYPGNGTCGNPAASCGVRVWGDISWSSENDARSTTIRHQADSSGGQSGSAFYHYADPSCSGCGYGAYLVGMHRAGYSSYNQARRYNSTVRSFMLSYSSDY